MQPTVQAIYGPCEGYIKGGRLRRPPFVDMLLNAANNALHDAGHAESLLPLRFELLTAT